VHPVLRSEPLRLSGPVLYLYRASVEPKTCASGSEVGASSVLRSGPVRASVEPKTCASGSKVGASSVLRSGPIRASVEPKTCASGSKVGASSVFRSGPVPVFCVRPLTGASGDDVGV